MKKTWTKRLNEEQARLIRSSSHAYEGIAGLRTIHNNGHATAAVSCSGAVGCVGGAASERNR